MNRDLLEKFIDDAGLTCIYEMFQAQLTQFAALVIEETVEFANGYNADTGEYCGWQAAKHNLGIKS